MNSNMKLKIRRLIATFIDYAIILFTVSILSQPIFKFIDNNILTIILCIVSVVIVLYLVIHKDLLFKNASIGKKIMKLGIYINNEIPDKKIIINRNKETLWLIALYVFQVLINNKSSGDIKYNTEVKNLNKLKQ